MRYFVYVITMIWVVFETVACTEYVDVTPETFENNIVIDATLTDEFKYHEVILSGTKALTATTFPSYSDAKVILSFNDTLIHFIESDTLSGHYFSDTPFAGIPNTTYTITINTVDGNKDGILDEYMATAKMGAALTLDSIGYYYYPNPRAASTIVTCYAWDPPETNFYNFRAKVNGKLTTDTIYEFNATDDLFFNGNYTNGVPVLFLHDDNKDEYIEQGDTITLIIENIEEAYYNYILNSINEYYGQNPMFGGMPANIESNFTNGALGIFRVYTIAASSVVVKEKFDRN